MSPKLETQDLVTPPQAARLKGTSREWIYSLMRRGKIEVVEVAGRQFVRLQEVLNYKPESVGGRPPAPKPAQPRTNSRKRGVK